MISNFLKIKKTKRFSPISILVLFLALIIAVFYWQINIPVEKYSQKETIFNIKKGDGLFDISSNLKKEGLINSKFLFNYTATVRNIQNNLQAGEYALSPTMSISKILKIINQGETVKQEITIIEGWGLGDIGQYLESKGLFQAEEFFEIAGFQNLNYPKAKDSPEPKDFSEEFGFLKEKPKNVGLEGYLFPDTYEIDEEEGIENIIRKTLRNFDKKFNLELRKKVEEQGRSLYQVLTMASLLEKEVKTYEDKKNVASILWKRLRNGWPLQVDASVIYLTGKKSLSLTKEDLEKDSLYNTYKYLGLPLGPICNPGLDSIKATIYYEENPYWFYLTTPEGETIFSKTLEEHNTNKWKYIK